MMNLPCVTISAPQGHSGKTIVSLGLLAALRQRGLVVQPFKKGPDYIDPSWLSAASNRDCRNLDTILMPEDIMVDSFHHAISGADVALIEGAMGLYDGFDSDGRGSTANVTRLLGSPVILVVNTKRMTRSIAALVGGYQKFEPETNIKGVILNHVSGDRHRSKMVNAIENYCGIPVVGNIPDDNDLKIAERHLGLTPFAECETAKSILGRICQKIEPYLDINGIIEIAHQAKIEMKSDSKDRERKKTIVKIGVIKDKVFNFYYPDNLEALRIAGAELVFIDSLVDVALPDIDALYVGGGFPEFFLGELEANKQLRRCIAQAIEDYMPVYAECAGLMYLCRAIRWNNRVFEMVGIIPTEVDLCSRPQGHGYVFAKVFRENPFLKVGTKIQGHEFHHSRLVDTTGLKLAYRLQRSRGIDANKDAILYKNTLASFIHIHALGVPQWADSLVYLAQKYHKLSIAKI